jgi:hypothetical protein
MRAIPEHTIEIPTITAGSSNNANCHFAQHRGRGKLAAKNNNTSGDSRQEATARYIAKASSAGKWRSAAAQPELGYPSATAPMANISANSRALRCCGRLNAMRIASTNSTKREK